MMDEQPLKGTTTIGIVCKDGVVLAADRRVTGGYIVNKKFRKISPISDTMAVSMAGLVSDAQLLLKLIKAELKLKDIQSGRSSNVREAANLLASLLYMNIRKMTMVPGIVGFLLAGKDDEGYHLYDLGIDGSVTKSDDYSSDGSGCMFALGVLESHYKKNLSVADGIKLAVKAINAALQRDPATGNGLDVITVTDEGVELVLEKELVTMIEV